MLHDGNDRAGTIAVARRPARIEPRTAGARVRSLVKTMPSAGATVTVAIRRRGRAEVLDEDAERLGCTRLHPAHR